MERLRICDTPRTGCERISIRAKGYPIQRTCQSSASAEGGAVIDDSNYNKRYDIATAREAFARAMAVHGWDKITNK